DPEQRWPGGTRSEVPAKPIAPSGVAVKPRPEPVKPEPRRPEPREKPTDKLVAKGRLLLIAGHGRNALDQFRRAAKMAPKDASLRLYEQQALGKLGEAELVLEGRG